MARVAEAVNGADKARGAAQKRGSGFEEWEFPLDMSLARKELGGMSLGDLAAIPFEQLGKFKQAQSFPHGYSRESLTFYAPRDPGVHQVLLWTMLQAKSSIAINMYGFDDPHLVSLLRHHASNPRMIVTLSLDSSQAGGKVEKKLLELLQNDVPGNSIAIGRSEHGAISHDKLMVVDGLFLVSGSTNWSFGGEAEQDNQLTLTRDAIACAEARAVIDLDHDIMLKQMAAKPPAPKARPRRRVAVREPV
jgi:PLD-like domain